MSKTVSLFFTTHIYVFSLIKEENQRPKYNKLLEHPFIKRSDAESLDVASYISEIMAAMENDGAFMYTMNNPW